MSEPKSVEEIVKVIEQYKLMSSKDLAAMRARWFRPNRKDANDPEQFRRWLVLNKYLTEFVAKVVSGRHPDQLVLNQYRLIDQLASGPMAGAYLAVDPLDRQVAIEVLAAGSAQNVSLLMGFQKAAQKAMTLDHPNVGRTVDVGDAHGLYYLVKEYYEGQTLEDILQRRGKLPYPQATRIMALALAGVEALHAQEVPGGDLSADCLLLASAGKHAPNQRTVKVLHAGVRRKLFDETAIGRTVAMAAGGGIPADLPLASSCTFSFSAPDKLNPPEDIFRLGCVFYRSVTGKAPFTEQELPCPSRPAKPVRELAPDVPEMLSEIIEQMIDPAPANRQQKAAHIAKSLRVFLAADEQGHEARAEENVAAPTARPVRVAEEEPEEDADTGEMDQEETSPPIRERASADGAADKAFAMWDEIRPEVRDLVFLASGALGMLVLIFLAEFITGIKISYLAGLATGAAASYFVEMFIRWRREKAVGVS
jgi:serine/threonine protein kinase